MGNRQTNFFAKKVKSVNTIDVFSSPKWYNISQNDNFLWVWTREVKLGKTQIYYPSWSFTKLNRNLWRVTLSKILFPNTGHWGIRFCPRVKFASRIVSNVNDPSAGSPTVYLCFTQFDFSSSNPQKIIILGDIISLGGWKHIYCIQTFHFFIKKVSLSVSHQYTHF